MRTFAIYNPLERHRRAIAWLHFNPSNDHYAIEIANWSKPQDLPLMLALLAQDGQYDIGGPLAKSWLEQRLPPETRDNIDKVLKAGHDSHYYLPALISQTKGRSSLDDFLIEEVPAQGYRNYNLNKTFEAPVRLAKQISRARRAAGLTQAQLAEECGIQQAVISRIESGKGNPTLETLEALARGCGRTLRLTLE